MFPVKLFRVWSSHLWVPLSIVGFDVFEVFFSKVGGLIQNERTYGGCVLVESVGTLARIAKLEVDPKGQSFNKDHNK